jgi:hypothetical protein
MLLLLNIFSSKVLLSWVIEFQVMLSSPPQRFIFLLNLPWKPGPSPRIQEVFWSFPPPSWIQFQFHTDGMALGCPGQAAIGGEILKEILLMLFLVPLVFRTLSLQNYVPSSLLLSTAGTRLGLISGLSLTLFLLSPVS